MKLGVVLRSVAILVAAPLLALPAGGAEDEPASKGADPAGLRPQPKRVVVEHLTRREPARAAVAPDRIVVDCAKDGCVVQNGLDVLVVGP